MPVVRYELQGDNSDLKAALEETRQEFVATGQAAETAGKKIETAAKSKGKAADESKRLKAGLEGAKQAATAMGGQVGALGGQVEAGTRAFLGLGEALGPVGVGAAALIASVGALAAGLALVGSAAVSAQDRLAAAGNSALIPAEAKAGADAYRTAVDRLKNAGDALIVTYGSGVLPALTDVANSTVTLMDRAIRLHEVLEGLAGITYKVASVASLGAVPAFFAVRDAMQGAHDAAVGWLGNSESVSKWLRDNGISATQGAGKWLVYAGSLLGAEDQAYETKKAVDALSDSLDDYQDYGPTLQDLAEGQRKFEEAARKAAEAARKVSEELKRQRDQAVAGIQAQLDATANLDQITQDAFRSTLTGEAAVRVAHLDRLKAIDELAAASQDAGAAEAARSAEEIRFQRELRAEQKKTAEAEQKAAQDAWKADLDRAADRLKAHTAAAEQEAALQRQVLDASVSTFNAIGDGIQSLLQQRIDAARDGSAAEKHAALATFAATKALGITQIAVNTAVAIMKALADLGPVAGGIAAAGAFATGTTQAALVATQKAPEFAGGGIVDQVLATHGQRPSADHVPTWARPGEGYLTQRGVRGAGGREGVEALNRGQPMAREPLVVQNVWKHRIFDSFVQENIRRGGPLARAISSARKSGHSRRT